jgi:hypothetical protein
MTIWTKWPILINLMMDLMMLESILYSYLSISTNMVIMCTSEFSGAKAELVRVNIDILYGTGSAKDT